MAEYATKASLVPRGAGLAFLFVYIYYGNLAKRKKAPLI